MVTVIRIDVAVCAVAKVADKLVDVDVLFINAFKELALLIY